MSLIARRYFAPQHRDEENRLPAHRSLPHPLMILGDARRSTGGCAPSVLGPVHEPFPSPVHEPSGL